MKAARWSFVASTVWVLLLARVVVNAQPPPNSTTFLPIVTEPPNATDLPVFNSTEPPLEPPNTTTALPITTGPPEFNATEPPGVTEPPEGNATGPPPLTIVGNGGQPPNVYPLAKCEGDCSQDTDCEESLICFQRDAGTAITIPGCSGTTDPSDSTDYCFDPADIQPNTLTFVGNNSAPPIVFPLQKCQGDCDSNADCAAGLFCFVNNNGTTVPGCDGTVLVNVEYCADPDDFATPAPTALTLAPFSDAPSSVPIAISTPAPGPRPLVIVGQDGQPPNVYPLSRCEGDCNSESDCEDGLICFQRDAGTEITIPGCIGTTDPSDSNDYCFDAADIPPNTLTFVGNNSVPAALFPLQKCQGDCDFDSDCAAGLFCFINNNGTTVPGCDGTTVVNVEYCADLADFTTPAPTVLTLAPVPSPATPEPTTITGTLEPTTGTTTTSPPSAELSPAPMSAPVAETLEPTSAVTPETSDPPQPTSTKPPKNGGGGMGMSDGKGKMNDGKGKDSGGGMGMSDGKGKLNDGKGKDSGSGMGMSDGKMNDGKGKDSGTGMGGSSTGGMMSNGKGGLGMGNDAKGTKGGMGKDGDSGKGKMDGGKDMKVGGGKGKDDGKGKDNKKGSSGMGMGGNGKKEDSGKGKSNGVGMGKDRAYLRYV